MKSQKERNGRCLKYRAIGELNGQRIAIEKLSTGLDEREFVEKSEEEKISD